MADEYPLLAAGPILRGLEAGDFVPLLEGRGGNAGLDETDEMVLRAAGVRPADAEFFNMRTRAPPEPVAPAVELGL